MRITILTAGTRGDTQPYLALGVGLQRAGHQVRVAAAENFETFVRQFGIDFAPVHTNLTNMLNSKEVQDILDADNPIQFLIAQSKAFRLTSQMGSIDEDIWNACQDADAILYSFGLSNGYFVARYLGKPCVALNVVPTSPTTEFPAVLFYDGPRLGAFYNRLTHALFEQAFWLPFRSGIQKFWRQRDKTVRIPFNSPAAQQRKERLPILFGYSEKVFPRPHDWPDQLSVTGYWFLDNEPNWKPSPALVDFLQAGPPPIYIGFGSMSTSSKKAQKTTETILKALEMTGQRGILASGWNGLSSDVQLPSSVLMLDSAPHGWLFPQMAAVVHHGGAGTTAAGLRAGVPSIIVPHSVDQPMWGRRVAELGVGPAPIPRKQLTAERLASAITATMDNAMRSRAQALGAQLAAEDGVANAVKVLEKYLTQ